MKTEDIARTLGLELRGDPSREITRITSPDKADTQSLCVIWDKHIADTLPPEIPIVAPEDFFTSSRDGIISDNPRALLPKLL